MQCLTTRIICGSESESYERVRELRIIFVESQFLIGDMIQVYEVFIY